MASVAKCGLALCAVLTSVLVGCSSDKSTGPSSTTPVTIPFTSQSSWCAGYAPGVITVTQLLGPSGSTTSNPLPGTWIVRGTYDLTHTSYTSAKIEMSFLGSVVTGENGQSIQEVPYSISGTLSGTFEAKGGFLRLESGPGTPGAMISSGSNALDCVVLH